MLSEQEALALQERALDHYTNFGDIVSVTLLNANGRDVLELVFEHPVDLNGAHTFDGVTVVARTGPRYYALG